MFSHLIGTVLVLDMSHVLMVIPEPEPTCEVFQEASRFAERVVLKDRGKG